MNGIRVDPVARTARAEGGVLWRELDRETQAFGLATTGGTVSNTGIAGLTLGGGLGWLMGKHGLTVDNLLSADIVTADGVFHSVDADARPRPVLGAAGRRRQLRDRDLASSTSSTRSTEVLGGLVVAPPRPPPATCCASTATSARPCPTRPRPTAALLTDPEAGDPDGGPAARLQRPDRRGRAGAAPGPGLRPATRRPRGADALRRPPDAARRAQRHPRPPALLALGVHRAARRWPLRRHGRRRRRRSAHR